MDTEWSGSLDSVAAGSESLGRGVLAMIHSVPFWTFVFLGLGFLFILPTLIGFFRDVEGKDLVVLLNLLALITAGAGWFGAMLLACRMPRRVRHEPVYFSPPAAAAEGLPWPFGDSAPPGYPDRGR